MITRTARTAWNGSLFEGSGQVELTSSGLATFDVTFPKRISVDAGGVTSPEELLAAAHCSCFAMTLSNLVAQAGGTPESIEVQADVTVGADPAGGHTITGIHLTLRAEIEGLDDAAFQQVAAEAKSGCPISKALAAVSMTLDAQLA